MGLLPGESAPTVMRLNEPLRTYLEKRLGIPVELFVGANYAATGEALTIRAPRHRLSGAGDLHPALARREARTLRAAFA